MLIENDAARRRATKIGALAIVLWAMLASLSTAARRIPPFELLTLTFAIAGTFGLARLLRKGGQGLSALRQPIRVWLVGTSGLFGYHALYFAALAKAPAAHVSLIAYLWPLLIVLLSGRTSGEATRRRHLLGAALGLFGVVLLIGGNGGDAPFQREYLIGYLAALACAFAWSGYSVLNRRFGTIPTDSVTGFCLVTAVLGGICHVTTETTIVPTLRETMVVCALGLGPVGAAFFLWDHGTKHGDLQMLGILSYATPLLSTLLLVIFRVVPFSWDLAFACLLIVSGAWIGSRSSRSGAPSTSVRGASVARDTR